MGREEVTMYPINTPALVRQVQTDRRLAAARLRFRRAARAARG